jgi:ribosomal 50S subunit-associated protein YjgA (DUF615 family)
VASHFCDLAGRLIAQVKFSFDANAATVMAALDEWKCVQKEQVKACPRIEELRMRRLIHARVAADAVISDFCVEVDGP